MILASVDAGSNIKPMQIFHNLPSVCQSRLGGTRAQSHIANWLSKTFKHGGLSLFSLQTFGKILKEWGPGSQDRNKVSVTIAGR